jgi:hypothetical protein
VTAVPIDLFQNVPPELRPDTQGTAPEPSSYISPELQSAIEQIVQEQCGCAPTANADGGEDNMLLVGQTEGSGGRLPGKADVAADVEQLRIDVGTIDGSVKTLQLDVDPLAKGVPIIDTRLGKVETDLKGIPGRIESLSDRVHALESWRFSVILDDPRRRGYGDGNDVD